MAVEIWENMPKNQGDSEKIEEAIDRVIGEHNDDENSHVEEGQSLTSHKAAKVIDHIARSVVGDKLNNIDDVFTAESFEIVDTYNYSSPNDIITVTGASWVADELIGKIVVMLSGDAQTGIYKIIDNTDDTLTLIEEIGAGTPANGDNFKISKFVFMPVDGWTIDNADVTTYNGLLASANTENDTIEYTVECDNLVIIGNKGPSSGIINIYIDDELQDQADLYDEVEQYRVPVYEQVFETTADRKITIEIDGTKNASSSGYLIQINAIDIDGIIDMSSIRTAIMGMDFSFNSNSNGYYQTTAEAPEGWQVFNKYGEFGFHKGNASYLSPTISMYPDAGAHTIEFDNMSPSEAYSGKVYFLIIKKDDPYEGIDV